MPEPLIRRALFSIALILCASSIAARARAADGESRACVAGLRVTVGPDTLAPARARRMLEQIVAELEPQRGEADATCDDGATRIDVDVGDTETRVVIDAQRGGARRRIERTIDVSKIAEDGRPLAVAIAVDEMAREAHEQLSLRAPAPAPPLPPPSPPPRPVAPPILSARGAFGAALGLDLFTSGVTLLGVDARGEALLGAHFVAGARAGVRGALAWDGGATEAWVLGGSLAISPDAHAPQGIAGVVAVDAFVARAGSRETAAATVAPSCGGRAWIALGDGLQLTLDARVGAPASPLRAPRQDGTPATEIGGALVGASLGVVAAF